MSNPSSWLAFFALLPLGTAAAQSLSPSSQSEVDPADTTERCKRCKKDPTLTALKLQGSFGLVISSQAAWDGAGENIVTTSVIRSPSGELTTVKQFGGRADGVGMTVFDGPMLLQKGMTVAVQTWSSQLHKTQQKPTWLATAKEIVAPGAVPYARTIAEETAVPLYWNSSCAFIGYNNGGTSQIDGDKEFTVLDQVIDNWQQSISSCSYLTIKKDGMVATKAKLDGRSYIVFREDSWCRESKEDGCVPMPPSAAGLTTVFYVDDSSSDHNGQIYDADIEINGVNFAISSGGKSGGNASCLADLANTLAHEFGHFLGLDHTCYSGETTHPFRDDGELTPSCDLGAPSAEELDATMFAYQECGETSKISLTDDDINGVCETYPKTGDAPSCERPSLGTTTTGCCSVGDGHRGQMPWATLLLGAFCLLLLRPRATHRS